MAVSSKPPPTEAAPTRMVRNVPYASVCSRGLRRTVWSGLPGGVREHGCLGTETASLGTCGRPPVMAAVRVAVGRLHWECLSSPQVCRPRESQVFPPGEGLPEPPLDPSRLWPPSGRGRQDKGSTGVGGSPRLWPQARHGPAWGLGPAPEPVEASGPLSI